MKRLGETGDDIEETRAEIDYWLDGRVVCSTMGGDLLRRGAMVSVLQRIWADYEEELCHLDAIIIADACYPCVLRCLPWKDRLSIVVLAGEVCDWTEEKQLYIIAHELAHFLLGHCGSGAPIAQQAEVQADELAESWGFKRPNGLPPHPALRPHGAPG